MALGVTDTVPDAVEVERPRLLPVIVTEEALRTFHDRVDEEPAETDEGVNEKALTAGVFSTFRVVDAVEVLFEVSVESAHSVVEPLASGVVFHATEYNVPLAVEVEPTRVLEARFAP